jgi:hypothetical protein
MFHESCANEAEVKEARFLLIKSIPGDKYLLQMKANAEGLITRHWQFYRIANFDDLPASYTKTCVLL